MKTFVNFLLEDAVPANHVSGAVAGLDQNPPVRRRKRNPILAALRRNKPLTTKRPHPIVAAARKILGHEQPVTETVRPMKRTLGELIGDNESCGCPRGKLCHNCNRPGIGYCLLGTHIEVMQ